MERPSKVYLVWEKIDVIGVFSYLPDAQDLALNRSGVKEAYPSPITWSEFGQSFVRHPQWVMILGGHIIATDYFVQERKVQ